MNIKSISSTACAAIATVMLTFTVGSADAEAASNAKSVKPSGSFLSAKLPGDIKRMKKTRDTVVGDIESSTVAGGEGDAELSITASVLPRAVTTLATDNILYRKARGEMLKKFGASKSSWKSCNHRGHECRKLTYKTSDGERGLARFYLDGDTLVVINAVYEDDKDVAEAFLASAR